MDRHVQLHSYVLQAHGWKKETLKWLLDFHKLEMPNGVCDLANNLNQYIWTIYK